MSKTNKLIPEIRFPEFENEGGWGKESIDNQFDLQDGCPFSSFDFTKDKKDSKQVIRITDINNQNSNEEKVYLPNSKIKDLDISKYEAHSGDLLLSLTGAAGFNFFIWNTESGFINQRTMKISPKKKENEALKFLLEPLIHKKINSIGTGQNNNLSKDALKDIEFPFPKPKEQQKLSSFITNLNDLIAAHSQKLELLKDHKKGLMQNLFPTNSITNDQLRITDNEETRNSQFVIRNLPKLRFKEFEKDGEWVEKKLGEICNMQAGKFVNASEINSQYSEELFPCYGGNGLRGFTKSFTHTGTYSLIGRQGALCGNITLAKGDFHATEHAVVVTPSSNIDTIWLYYELELLNLNQYATGQAQPGLSVSNLEQVQLFIPKTIQEQQKIASCLSSLDALITAQAEKIAQLKLHKKGLMQGLFPKLSETGFAGLKDKQDDEE